MKIYPNPNLPHFMERKGAHLASQKPIADTRSSIDTLLARNSEALERLNHLRPTHTKRTSS